MSFIEKEKEMLKKLHSTNFEMFDGDKDEAFEFVESSLSAFPAYANTVIMEQIKLPMIRARYDGQEYRDAVTQLDRDRHYAHESAITSVNMLNRLCTNLEIEPFANIDTSDRHAVAELVGQFVNEVYNQGIGNTFDDAVLNKDRVYDHTAIKSRIDELSQELNVSNSEDRSPTIT
ncbi:DUF3232 domain-containing protein [bacterium]|nr:DUF3232 domain-containing protein [bacterium]